MVESSDQAGFIPNETEQALISKHLGNEAIIDEKFKSTVVLTK